MGEKLSLQNQLNNKVYAPLAQLETESIVKIARQPYFFATLRHRAFATLHPAQSWINKLSLQNQLNNKVYAPLAQLDRALVYGTKG
ncbi:MAG: hypothetical protein IJZ73_00510 [Clostridia bacterium]|nr:hypothetical protein [Clostridia bacterium]